MRPYKLARSTGAHAGSPSTTLFTQFVCSDDEDRLQECADTILKDLDASRSLLRGMFRSFLREANIRPSAKHSRTEPNLHRAKRPRNTEMLLKVTLEDLCDGAVKSVPVQRKKHDARGHVLPVQDELQVHVPAGLRDGTRITLTGQGGDCHDTSSALTFIIQQQSHPTFKRVLDDLYTIVNVPLLTALTGGSVSLRTISGQVLQLPISDIITPASKMVLPNLGMPVYGDEQGRRGALHVKFNVKFPQQLSQQQQLQLKMALAGVEHVPLCRPAAGLPTLAAADSGQPRQQFHDVDVLQYSRAKEQQQQGWQPVLEQAYSGSSSGCSSAYACVELSWPGSSMCQAGADSSSAEFACTNSTSSSRYHSACCKSS